MISIHRRQVGNLRSKKAAMMADEAQAPNGQVLAFGPFRLRMPERMLQEGERPIRLGSRSLEILLILVERAGELVDKEEIKGRVWPGMVTEEATLRVHIAALRKVLGHSRDGARYVENVTGRGYRFVAQVTRLEDHGSGPVMQVAAAEWRHGLPNPLIRMIGRSEIVGALEKRLPQQRFVTISGPGGIGKTTVALAAADKLAPSYRHRACFVDLASTMDPRLVPSTLASVLGLEVLSDDPVPVLLAFLRDKHLLIVLDNCEHVVAAAAALAETVLRAAPSVHILTTSREPLRAEGEWVLRLSPLGIPPSSATLTASEALKFPAIELFTERARASLDDFELSDADASIVADLCRRLDGIPLAIELAAARVGLFGIRELAARLENCLQLLTKGRRTALPRQQTLRATLDWSHGLLSSTERMILRRIAVFPGGFDLASAGAIAADFNIGTADVFHGISNLAAKSLIAADVTGEQVLFRLLNTTRAYALEMLEACSEGPSIRRRHAQLCCADCDTAKTLAPGTADRAAIYYRKLDDVRIALDWCFSPEGEASIGVELTAASAPLWFRLSVVDEYRNYVERSLRALETDPTPNATLKMMLNVRLGNALLHARGPTPALAAAFNRAHESAKLAQDASNWWEVYWGLAIAQLAGGDYPAAVDFSDRCRRASSDAGVLAAVLGDRLSAMTYHHAGSHAAARRHAERLLDRPVENFSSLRDDIYQIDQRLATRAILCRILWVQGFPDQALSAARATVEDGLSDNHALSICFASLFACPVMLWTGDVPAATRLVATVLDRSAQHALTYWHQWGRCFAAALELCHGNGAEKFGRHHELLRDPRSTALHLEMMGALSQELVGAEAIARAETGDAGWCAAEILRAKGEIILREGASEAALAAGTLFHRSLDTAHLQGALSWELRAAVSLAQLLRRQARFREAHDLLAPVYARFTEGFGTADLVTARKLLEQLDP
jgi:predicted ATPase/DNA-binding winged helix-turn-helix (wHTH) protein